MNNNTGKSKRIVRYKCPYCNIRDTRENLVDHIKDEHDDMIPKGYTAFRVVFDYVNKKPMGYNGKCTECGGPTGWDEDKGRYNRQCSKPACKASYLKKFEDNMIRTQGTTRISNTAEGQEKMLANRKISGTYKFSDGGEKTYTGSYERKALEFMDQVMEIKSDDILCPGLVLEYSYQGAKHMYITDFYYQPYNLIIEVKDGGNNPNKRNMPEYRAKQIAKEQYIIKHTNYNYIRLTDNNFQQLLSVFISLKFEMLENSGERVIQVNESVVLERTAPRGEVTIYHGSSNGNYEYILANSPNNGKKWEKIRMSSFWFLEKKYAIMFATAELIYKESNKKIPIFIDNDMKALILDEYKDLAQSIIKKNECYVYIKTIDGKYLTGGQGRNFPEYTLDFNVKPDEVYICTQQDMSSSIKFVSPEYMDEVIQKYNKNKMKYGNSFLGSMIDNLIYDNNEDIVKAKRIIKGYNESSNISSNDSQMNEIKALNYDYLNLSEAIIAHPKNLYFISTNNMDNKILQPRVPTNYMTKNGYEDGETARVCFAPSIDKCLMAISQNCTGMELYVHIPDDISKYEILKPDISEVPDSKITDEYWICSPVKLKSIGKIKVIGDAGEDGISYKYGDKTAELYKWNWEWLNKFNESIIQEDYLFNESTILDEITRADINSNYLEKCDICYNLNKWLDEYSFLNEDTVLTESKDVSTLTDGFKTKSGKTFKLVDVDTPEALKYVSEKWRESKNGKTLYVALSEQDDYEIAGFIGWNKSGSIAPLRVYEKFRGYGLSEILLKLAIKNGGYKLGVFSDNEVAIRLYKKFGFIEVDRKTYKDGDVVIIMELKNKISESTILTNYTFLDIQSNKSKVLKYLKDNNETQKYAQDTIDNYNGEIIVFDNKMIGRILVGDKKDKGFITDLSVDKEFRGNKLGSKLLDDAINKYGGYDLLVNKSNKLAIDMYRKRGFEITKTYKNQYYMILKNKQSITEGKVFDSDSIFYNKTKWDKGTINLCFVTGHSGSGKSTYAHNLEKRDGTVEVYELDDVVCVDHFSDDNLNEYGDLISSFFKKNSKYRIPYKVEDYNGWEKEKGFTDHVDYCRKVVSDFIKYSIQFAKTHSKRYVIEGVQILSFTDPELYKSYSIYLLGTSAFKSYIRSTIRDLKNEENNKNRRKQLRWLMDNIKNDQKDYKYYEDRLELFRKYYKPLQEKIDKAEDKAFNELMSMVGYAPVRGIESSDAYIVNYMSNKVFTSEPSEAKIRDKIGVTNTRSLHTIIGLDDNQRLTKINKEDVHNPILYKIGKTNKEVSNILERCMESVVYKEYVYEALTGQKVYGDMSSQAEATLERVEILDEKKFKSVIESYLDSEGSVDEISRDLDNIEAKIEDLKKEGLA